MLYCLARLLFKHPHPVLQTMIPCDFFAFFVYLNICMNQAKKIKSRNHVIKTAQGVCLGKFDLYLMVLFALIVF